MIHYTAAMFLVSGGAVLADMTDHRTATVALLILWAFMAVMLVVAKAIDWVFRERAQGAGARQKGKVYGTRGGGR